MRHTQLVVRWAKAVDDGTALATGTCTTSSPTGVVPKQIRSVTVLPDFVRSTRRLTQSWQSSTGCVRRCWSLQTFLRSAPLKARLEWTSISTRRKSFLPDICERCRAAREDVEMIAAVFTEHGPATCSLPTTPARVVRRRAVIRDSGGGGQRCVPANGHLGASNAVGTFGRWCRPNRRRP